MIEDNLVSKMNSFRNGVQSSDDKIKCDLMSVGIIIYMLMIGMAPFQGKSSMKLMEEAQVGYIGLNHPLWR